MKFTALTSQPGYTAPGKRFTLKEGALKKETIGTRTAFDAVVLDMTLEQFAEFIEASGPDVHLTAGLPAHQVSIAYSAEMLRDALRNGTATGGVPAVGLTNADIRFREAPGMLVIDTDAMGDVTVLDQLAKANPGIERYACATTTSSGANIYLGKTQLKGASGQHTFFHVLDATDIPRAINTLHVRLVIAGFLMPRISAAGSYLERSAVDRQLAVPSQPVFLRAFCSDGLSQHKVVAFHPGIEVIDTHIAIPTLTADEMATYAEMVAASRAAMADELAAVRAEYIKTRAETLSSRSNGRLSTRQAVSVIAHGLVGATLGSEYLIELSDGSVVTVRDIFANLSAYHRKTCRDPLEPDYGSKTVAMIFTSGLTPTIHSFAHGGRTYRLQNENMPTMELDEALTDLADDDAADVRRMAGDPALAMWLKAEKAIGKTKIGDRTADGIATDLLSRRLGITEGNAPDAIEVMQGYSGLGLRVKIDGKAYHLVLSLPALKSLLTTWMATDPDAALDGFVDFSVEYANLVDAEETKLAAIPKDLASVTKVPVKDVREALAGSVAIARSTMLHAQARSNPQIDISTDDFCDPLDAEIAGLRREAEIESGLLDACRDIAEHPTASLQAAMRDLGVSGEEDNVMFLFLIMLSSALNDPSSGLLKGPAGSGKSKVLKAVSVLFPEEAVYLISSVSAKAIIYDPVGFKHRTIILEEAEALVRNSADDKNDVAEMLRVLLSEKRLVHKTVVKDAETNKFVTETHIVDGPTNLVTSTTRGNLDQEISSRMVDRYSDTSAEHMRDVMGVLGRIHSGDLTCSVDLEQWHSFVRWVRRGPKMVVVPFANLVAGGFPIDAGSRAYRDFNNLMAVTKAAALANRLNRTIDRMGRLVAELDDYTTAYACLGARIDEMSEAKVPDEVMAVFRKLRPLIEANAVGDHFIGSDLVACWNVSGRELAKQLDLPHSSVRTALARLETNGLVEFEKPASSGRNAKFRVALAKGWEHALQGSDAGMLLTPDKLRKAIADAASNKGTKKPEPAFEDDLF